MDTQLIQYLLKVGADLKTDTFRAESEPAHVYYRRTGEDTFEKVLADPTPRKHVATAIATVVKLAADNRETAEIWHSRHGVTLYLDGEDRRNTVTMDLALSPQIKQLQVLETQKPGYQQATIIKELRITFAGCLAGNLVDLLRRVKFNATQDTDSAVGHGKVSLGKKITAEVTGTDVLPDQFVLTVPVFLNPQFAHVRYGVKLALEPDASTCTFQMIPFPGSVDQAIGAGEAEVHEEIVEALKKAGAEDVPVYLGKA